MRATTPAITHTSKASAADWDYDTLCDMMYSFWTLEEITDEHPMQKELAEVEHRLMDEIEQMMQRADAGRAPQGEEAPQQEESESADWAPPQVHHTAWPIRPQPVHDFV